MTTTKPSVSVQPKASSSRIGSNTSETGHATSVSPETPPSKTFARSPYREQTRMLRVPESLLHEFRARLKARRLEVAAGDHDHWE